MILLVDDDRGFTGVAAAALAREGFTVQVAHSLQAARKALADEEPELLVLDRRLPDGDGLLLLQELEQSAGAPGVVVVTAHEDLSSAVDAMRAGALDYVTKPVELPELVMRLRRAGEELRLRARLRRVEGMLSPHSSIVAQSPAMQKVLVELRRMADARGPVLLLGPTGAGKEVLARQLHALSRRSSGPFIHINCAALPSQMVESELFGHDRGAFTDAKVPRRGLVEVAAGGTLFLDELGELPLGIQAKLLTFLDSGCFRRLGGAETLTSNARVVGATNRDLERDRQEGRFREDLWFRMSVFQLRVPPLTERREDILPLSECLLTQLARDLGREAPTLSEGARQRLLAYPFPGNVRELRNVLERELVISQGPVLELESLEPSKPGRPEEPFRVEGPPLSIDELRRRYAHYVLQQTGGRKGAAARWLGLSHTSLLKWLSGGS